MYFIINPHNSKSALYNFLSQNNPFFSNIIAVYVFLFFNGYIYIYIINFFSLLCNCKLFLFCLY